MIRLLFWLAVVHMIPLLVFAWTEVLGISVYTPNQFTISVFMFISGMLVIATIDMNETHKSLNREHRNGQ